MPRSIEVTYEDDSSFITGYQISQVAKYYREFKKTNPNIKPMPLIPWIIGLAFKDAEECTNKGKPIKRIQIYEGKR